MNCRYASVCIVHARVCVCVSVCADWVLARPQSNGPANIVIAVVGNKTDLEENRQVSAASAQQFAKEINALFFECSAKSGVNVNEIFHSIGVFAFCTSRSHADMREHVYRSTAASRRRWHGQHRPATRQRGRQRVGVVGQRRRRTRQVLLGGDPCVLLVCVCVCVRVAGVGASRTGALCVCVCVCLLDWVVEHL